MLRKALAACALATCLPVSAADLKIELDIPRLEVAEYHRPYVALWIEQDNQHIANLNVWYDLKMKDNEGEKWLKDMRQWWRRSGRSLELPVDGVSGATRAVGTHSLNFNGGSAALQQLKAGDYELLVEAAREVGGREILRIPFSWPPSQKVSAKAQGSSELGAINLTLIP
ncbi:DUF2271 domain-containing protein [Denitrificimonas caeni]|uniref:DUF2271 domain-containing protein n=1 Tax=Denitrificimonas caeni TaxID=521720 RepID=UPI001966652D|nr:DUF2271 domain-containing protein [Denitrificimonas caeni]